MRKSNSRLAFAVTAAVLLGIGIFAQAVAQEPPPPPAPDDGVQVLTRGPLHEAFAEPVQGEPGRDPVIVTKQPPAAIEELPPDEKPAGDNVQWIAGYWAWDDEMKNFLWVSGIWRQTPPHAQWVAGYWNPIDGGWQWTPGMWAAGRENITYLPQPPAPVQEAVAASPGQDYFYVPGVYQYRESRFIWRAGYWNRITPNWIWVPAHYVVTPAGWVYVDGYWDYPIATRGVIFAPVYYTRPVFEVRAYRFRPTITIDTGLLSVNLFARPRYSHYYFGDYYAASYASVGIYPWFEVRSHSHFSYDPLFAYYSWDYGRRDPHWSVSLSERYVNLQRHEELRPPHTLAAQHAYLAEHRGREAESFAMARPIKEVAASSNSGMKFTTINERDRQVFAQQADANRHLAQQRVEVERHAASNPGKVGQTMPTLNLAHTQTSGGEAAHGATGAAGTQTRTTNDPGRRLGDAKTGGSESFTPKGAASTDPRTRTFTEGSKTQPTDTGARSTTTTDPRFKSSQDPNSSRRGADPGKSGTLERMPALVPPGGAKVDPRSDKDKDKDKGRGF